MILTPHFSWPEVTFSQTATRDGIDNSIVQGSQIEKNVIETAMKMEVVRKILDENQIHVSSWYRCLKLNQAIGAAPTSEHLTGYAIDFTCSEFGTPKEVASYLSKYRGFEFDQLIYEGTWVHVSFAVAMRQQVLTAHFIKNQKTTYSNGI